MIKTAQKMGIQPRVEINSPSEAEYYLNLGVRHFCVGTEVRILYNWFCQAGSEMRGILNGI